MGGRRPPRRENAMRIECSACEMFRSAHCDDCLVTALLKPPSDTVEIDDEDAGCLQELAGAGLIPVLRFRPRIVPAPPPDEAGDLTITA